MYIYIYTHTVITHIITEVPITSPAINQTMDFHGLFMAHMSHGLMFFVRVLPCDFYPPFFRGKQKRPNVIPLLGW